MEKELKGIKITQIERNTKIQYNKELKLLKYFIEEDNNIIRFNRGRFLEANARFTHNGIINIDLENVSHKVAGDITINGIEYNIKSYKAELRAEGVTLEEKINNYIKEDASDGFLYIIEHNEKYYTVEEENSLDYYLVDGTKVYSQPKEA